MTNPNYMTKFHNFFGINKQFFHFSWPIMDSYGIKCEKILWPWTNNVEREKCHWREQSPFYKNVRWGKTLSEYKVAMHLARVIGVDICFILLCSYYYNVKYYQHKNLFYVIEKKNWNISIYYYCYYFAKIST